MVFSLTNSIKDISMFLTYRFCQDWELRAMKTQAQYSAETPQQINVPYHFDKATLNHHEAALALNLMSNILYERLPFIFLAISITKNNCKKIATRVGTKALF
jgi:hypothetical protein